MELTNVKLPKDTARLVRAYCIITNQKVRDYITETLNRDLSSFQETLSKVRNAR